MGREWKILGRLLIITLVVVFATPTLLYAREKTYKFTIIYTGSVMGEIEPCG